MNTEINPGFQGSVIIRDLPRAELAKRGLPNVWFGEVQRDLVCVSSIGGTITIPAGMLTDGASIPRLLWNLLSDTDPDILYPSYVHDYMYLLKGKMPGIHLTRDQADNILREQMKIIGAPTWKADAVYRAVHLFGPHAWSMIRPQQQVMSARRMR